MAQHMIDLTHPIATGAPCYPSDPATALSPHCTLAREGFRVSRIETGTHQGTHVDAPSHFLENGATVDTLPLEPFFGPANLLRIPREAGQTIDLEALTPFDRLLCPGARIVVATGWDSRWGTAAYFTDPPALTLAAARLLSERRIALLGMDTPTPGCEDALMHEIFLKAGVALLESLVHLEQCPEAFTLCALPLALCGCDGSPVRAVAIA